MWCLKIEFKKRNSMCWHQYANICRDANEQTKNRESIYLAKYLNRQKKWDINRISITVFVWYTSTGCVLHFALPWIFFFLFYFRNMHMVNKNVWICEYKGYLRMKKKKKKTKRNGGSLLLCVENEIKSEKGNIQWWAISRGPELKRK